MELCEAYVFFSHYQLLPLVSWNKRGSDETHVITPSLNFLKRGVQEVAKTENLLVIFLKSYLNLDILSLP